MNKTARSIAMGAISAFFKDLSFYLPPMLFFSGGLFFIAFLFEQPFLKDGPLAAAGGILHIIVLLAASFWIVALSIHRTAQPEMNNFWQRAWQDAFVLVQIYWLYFLGLIGLILAFVGCAAGFLVLTKGLGIGTQAGIALGLIILLVWPLIKLSYFYFELIVAAPISLIERKNKDQAIEQSKNWFLKLSNNTTFFKNPYNKIFLSTMLLAIVLTFLLIFLSLLPAVLFQFMSSTKEFKMLLETFGTGLFQAINVGCNGVFIAIFYQEMKKEITLLETPAQE